MKYSNLTFLLIYLCLINYASPKIVDSIFKMSNLVETDTTYYELSNYYTSGLGGNVTIHYQSNEIYQNPNAFIYLDLIIDKQLEQYKQAKCITQQSKQWELILKRLVTTFPQRTYQQQVSYIISAPSSTQQAVPVKYYLMLSLCQPSDLISQMFIRHSNKLTFDITWFNGQSPTARDQQQIEVYLILVVVALITNVWLYILDESHFKNYRKNLTQIRASICFVLQFKLLFYVSTIIVVNKFAYEQRSNYSHLIQTIWNILAKILLFISQATLIAIYSQLLSLTNKKQAIMVSQQKNGLFCVQLLFVSSQMLKIIFGIIQPTFHPYSSFKNFNYIINIPVIIYFVFWIKKIINLTEKRFQRLLTKFMVGGIIYIIMQPLLRIAIYFYVHQIDQVKYQILLSNLTQLILLNYFFNQLRILYKQQKQIVDAPKIQSSPSLSNLQLSQENPAGSNQISNF